MRFKLLSEIHFFYRKKNEILSSNYSKQKINDEHKSERHYSFNVLGPNDLKISFSLNLSDMNFCRPIYAEIERHTKIPQKLLMLIYRGKVISPQHLASESGFAGEGTIHLSVKSLGGGGGDGESDGSGQSDEGVTTCT